MPWSISSLEESHHEDMLDDENILVWENSYVPKYGNASYILTLK